MEKLKHRDTIISFNYDCVIDYALKDYGAGKWNAAVGYGVPVNTRGKKPAKPWIVRGTENWDSPKPSKPESSVQLLKLHGSLHFNVIEGGGKNKPTLNILPNPYSFSNAQSGKFSIIPPESVKDYGRGVFGKIWARAAQSVSKAQTIVLIGYSLPPSDLHSTALFRMCANKVTNLVVVNRDQSVRKRTRSIFQRALDADSRIHSFDTFEEFVKVPRSVWDRPT